MSRKIVLFGLFQFAPRSTTCSDDADMPEGTAPAARAIPRLCESPATAGMWGQPDRRTAIS